MRSVKRAHPFRSDAQVVLPDCFHWVLALPPEDEDFSTRLRLIETAFAKGWPATERRSAVRLALGERGIRQRRYREHAIRDAADHAVHVDYVHINPVKDGYVRRAADWPCSIFHCSVARGINPGDWAANVNELVVMGERGG